MAGLTAFRKAYLSSDESHESTFESLSARRMRYALYWSMYENTAYDRVHTWSTSYKHQYAIYKYARGLYNPTYRIGSFYQGHLWGGALDMDGGLGGAIPIETDNDNLRPALMTLWQDSRMSHLKDVISLRGTVEGDIVLRVVDDTEKGLVYIDRVHPAKIEELTLDDMGNVKGYVLVEKRPHPESPGREVEYREVVSRDGPNVVYETFLNSSPYGWYGQPSVWEVPYTFVPMVVAQHNDVGLEWGWSEVHPLRLKIQEVDELASMVSDHIRKSIDPVYLMKGMNDTTITLTGAQGDSDTRPQPGREEVKAIWNVPKDASAEPILGDLDVGDALQHISALLSELERDYPELQTDIWATGATSGRALRIARQRVETKVLQRRESYDYALVRIQEQAMSIGGYRGYSGYEGFGLDSYDRGDLDHAIADRPVFTPDPIDGAEIREAEWRAINEAIEAGANLPGLLEDMGWPQERIERVVSGDQNLDNV